MVENENLLNALRLFCLLINFGINFYYVHNEKYSDDKIAWKLIILKDKSQLKNNFFSVCMRSIFEYL